MIHHVTRATRHLIFWSLVLTAIVLSGVRLALQGVEHYKSDLENRISELIKTPVTVGSLGAHMRGISPELVLKDIDVAPLLATEKPSIYLNEIRLGINLGNFLLNRDALSASWITLVGARLSVYRKTDGQFAIEGLKAGNGQPLWLLLGRKYQVLQSQITWQDKHKKGPPVVLEDVNLAVMNDDSHHRINLLAKLPKKYGDGLTMVLDFKGSVDKPSEMAGTVFFEGKNLKLHELSASYLPSDFKIIGGSTDVKVWSQWKQAKLASVVADTQLRQVSFSNKGKGAFPISFLDTQFSWHTKDNLWQLDIDRFLLESPLDNKKVSKKWPDAIVSVAGEQATEHALKKLKLYAQQLDLAEAAKVMEFFAPLDERQAQLLNQSQVSGLMRDFSFYAEPAFKKFAIAGWFDSVSNEPFLNIPGMTNVSGQIKGSDQIGKVEMASRDFQYKAPQLFDKPLKFSQLQVLLAWHQSEEQWTLSSPFIELNCPAFVSESRLLVNIPKTEEKPFIDFQTAFKSDDLGQIRAYLPTQIMKDKLKTWMTNAFLGGKVVKGDLLFYGKANDFPFKDGSGVFEAKLDLDKVELNYHPEWPKISAIKGELSLTGDNINGSFKQGQTGKVAINSAEMLISGLGTDELLTIKGEGQGAINDALSLLQQSPLANRVTPLLAGITLAGSTKTTLDLAIPLRPGHELKVEGKVLLNNAQLTVNRFGLKVNQLKGDLKFNNNGVYGDGIQANALGHPIKVNIAQAEQQTLVNVGGKASVSDLKKLMDWHGAEFARGKSDYALQLQIPNAGDGDDPLQITVESTLEGVALDFPGMLAKTTEQKKPTSLTVSLSDELALPIELDYNNELKAAISLNSKTRKMNSGHILIGNGDVKQSPKPGLTLEINREQLSLQDWLSLAATQRSANAEANINEIKIHSQSAFWGKTRLGAFDLSLKRNSSYWLGELDSAIGIGKFQLPVEPKGINPVLLDMDMLNISALKQLKMQSGSNISDFKPLLNISSKKTLWQSENLGQLALETERTPNGIKIKRLELIGADQKLAMVGNWKEIGLSSITHLRGKLEMKNADQLFDKLNITKDLSHTRGVIDFKLNWAAAPWQLSMAALRGSMDVKLKDGRILSIEPGFGRVLGILAVAQWIKRLQLDFSDIYEEGLSFNSIKGHFDLLDGKATTKNLTIDAVPAKITITGDTDLVNQTVDHVIKVVPKSLDALPIAGTIVSRVAAAVGKTLTGKDQEGFFFGTQYLVKGGWNDVKISSLHENDGLIQKTWNSITDFPWNEEPKK